MKFNYYCSAEAVSKLLNWRKEKKKNNYKIYLYGLIWFNGLEFCVEIGAFFSLLLLISLTEDFVVAMGIFEFEFKAFCNLCLSQ